MPLAGGSVTTLVSGQDEPSALALDATSVYWVNQGGGNSNGLVMKLTPK